MIMHKDGRIEGTPAELLEYARLKEKQEGPTEGKSVPGAINAIKNDFLKGQPWIPLPNNTKDLHDLVHRSKACECRSYGYTSCPECKHKITFEA